MRSFLSAVILVVIAILSTGDRAQAERRVSLVIGNSAYQHVPNLPNPSRDARDLSAVLERLGFTVIVKTDLDYNGMRTALRDFGRDALAADMALIFFAGHGMLPRKARPVWCWVHGSRGIRPPAKT